VALTLLVLQKIVVDENMKILTWNIERPKSENQLILEKLAEYNADIVI
jgi:hypothetical protein